MISIDSFNDDMYIYSILYTVDDYDIATVSYYSTIDSLQLAHLKNTSSPNDTAWHHFFNSKFRLCKFCYKN
jgi:hypothetical protein